MSCDLRRESRVFDNLIDLLLYRAEHDGTRTAYTFLDDGEEVRESVTYAEFCARVLALAGVLQRRLPPRERVLLLYPHCIDYMVAFFACLCANLIAVPLFPPRNTRHNSRLEAIAQDCAPRAALFSSRQPGPTYTLLKECPHIAGLELIDDEVSPAHAPAWIRPHTTGATVAYLQYTSGSTGRPKGVMVRHSNVIHNERMIQSTYLCDESTRILSWLPIYHDMGLIGNMLASFWLGGECVFMAPVAFLQSPIRWLRAITRFRANLSGGPDFAYDLCVEKIPQALRAGLDLSSWSIAFNGAEPVRMSTLERFTTAYAPYGFKKSSYSPCYGLAEATLIVAARRHGSALVSKWIDAKQLTQQRIVAATPGEGETLVGCGRPRPGVTVHIVDPVTCKLCAPGGVGEIWIAGPSIAAGYWGQTQLTEEVFNARIADCAEGAFCRTGDLGFLDNGELYITGRLQDLIKVLGAHHYPQYIETLVEASDPSINRTGVAAFAAGNTPEGRVIVVAEIARTRLRKIDPMSLTARIRKHVLEQRGLALDDVVLIRPGTLPKSSSGKVQRAHCRALYLANELEVIPTIGETLVQPTQRAAMEYAVQKL